MGHCRPRSSPSAHRSGVWDAWCSKAHHATRLQSLYLLQHVWEGSQDIHNFIGPDVPRHEGPRLDRIMLGHNVSAVTSLRVRVRRQDHNDVPLRRGGRFAHPANIAMAARQRQPQVDTLHTGHTLPGPREDVPHRSRLPLATARQAHALRL